MGKYTYLYKTQKNIFLLVKINITGDIKNMSTAGLEPARISPHAPQTCAYTDSAMSTYLILTFIYFEYFLNNTLALCPPKPNEFVKA